MGNLCGSPPVLTFVFVDLQKHKVVADKVVAVNIPKSTPKKDPRSPRPVQLFDTPESSIVRIRQV